MSAEITLIITLSIILLISPFISNILKLPISMVEMGLGSLAAAFGFLHHNEIFSLLAEIGFLYLMLLAGMEVDLKDILKLGKSIYKKAFLFLLFLYLLSFLVIYAFHFSLVFVVILPLISIGLLLSIQQEVGKTSWLDLAIKVGVIGELLSILVLTIISGYFEVGFSAKLFFNIFILFLFIATLAFVFLMFRTLLWWYPQLKLYLMPRKDRYYQDVRIAMSLFFIMIAIMITLHLDVVLGAFVVGVFLRTFFDHNHDLEKKLAPFGFGFLITIFFVYVGSNIDIFKINFSMILDVLKITFLMIGIRVVSAFVFFKELKKDTILFGLSLSMPLTLMIATATLAYQNHKLDEYWYTILVTASVIEVLVVMLGVKVINKLQFHKKG
ncbi:MAG: cation:proton antiporter [Nautiliaceae bacterium]